MQTWRLSRRRRLLPAELPTLFVVSTRWPMKEGRLLALCYFHANAELCTDLEAECLPSLYELRVLWTAGGGEELLRLRFCPGPVSRGRYEPRALRDHLSPMMSPYGRCR